MDPQANQAAQEIKLKLETGSPTLKRNVLPRGFTLIELLVVLVIIGVVIAAASFLLKDSGHGQTERSAINGLQQRLLLAEQQAILTGTPLGFAISQSGYQFYHLTLSDTDDTVHWSLITTNRALGYQTWPEHTGSGRVNLRLRVGEHDNVLVAEQLPEQPMIILNAGATVTPFELTMDHFILQGQLNGEIKIAK